MQTVNSDPSTAPAAASEDPQTLSAWWRYGALTVFLVGLVILVYLSVIACHDAPPIPETVVGPRGTTIFTGADIRAGQ